MAPVWWLIHILTVFSYIMMTRATEDVSEEISQIEETREQQSHGLTMTEAIRNLTRPDVRTPFLLITINFYFVMLSGPFAIIYYSVQIFQARGVGLDKHLAAIVVAAIRVLGGILGIFLIQKCPRVWLSMATMTLMSVSMAVLGGSLYMKGAPVLFPVLELLPVVSVTTFMFREGVNINMT